MPLAGKGCEGMINPLIWQSTGGPLQFRVQVEIVGNPSPEDCEYFESITALACKTMRRAANSQRFTGFDGIEVLEKAGLL